MIKYNIQNGGVVEELVVSGDLSTICADICVLVNTIYRELGNDDVKEAFKGNLETAFKDGIVFKTKPEDVVKAVKSDDELIDKLKEFEKMLAKFIDLSEDESDED